ncbi:MAG: signal recognition particle-docking protein FtsY [Alphaproteobacteria bacterium CG_4_10_14_0_8_um_filter_53_9]|nr:MAG: signal recognition particle-docking protein FtsY [Alphaproteobacteria bacterium CG_4_10_14_0_8_um_filter_53_9]
MSFWKRLTGGLGKTAQTVESGLRAALGLSGTMDAETREAVEEVLLKADVGVRVATALVSELAKKLPSPFTEDQLKAVLAGLIEARLKVLEAPAPLLRESLTVVAMVGVNGSGKTTTLGKMAAQWQAAGKRVLAAAGDTFRAGATEQVSVWAERAGADLVDAGGDAAAVAYAAVKKGMNEAYDVVLIDTAGRLPNRADLMAELGKIRRVVAKLLPEAPHHTLLVLDGTQGQAVLRQVEAFGAEAGVDGLIVTKLDSSAKAGFLLALAALETPLPVYYLGIGEGVDDLGNFEAAAFARSLVGLSEA